jgi:hypothetical protein
MSDTWFHENKENQDIERYIKFIINNNKIQHISWLNIMSEDYIKVDKHIKLYNLTVNTPLTIEELASVIFSVNQNYKVFEILKNFFTNLKKNEIYNYQTILYSNKMKIFCVHLAYLIVNTSLSNTIPEWLLDQPLFSEEIKMYESIHTYKFKKENIPSLNNYDKLFVSSMYLSFMIVYDRAKDMQSINPILPPNIIKILHGLVIDLNKANNILKLI